MDPGGGGGGGGGGGDLDPSPTPRFLGLKMVKLCRVHSGLKLDPPSPHTRKFSRSTHDVQVVMINGRSKLFRINTFASLSQIAFGSSDFMNIVRLCLYAPVICIHAPTHLLGWAEV